MKKLFELGRVVLTPGAMELFESNPDGIRFYLDKHQSGDWGNLDKEDAKENDLSVREGFRILSSYHHYYSGKVFWVITEADRSATTLLLPDEY